MIDVPALDQRAQPLAYILALGWKPARGSRPDHAILCCPLHADKTASFHVTRGPSGTLRGTCFGCRTTLDLIGMAAAAHGVDARTDFARAAKLAADAVGAELETTADVLAARRPPPTAPARRPLDFDGELSSVLVPLDSERAGGVAAYMATRGLLTEAVADDWRALDLAELRHQIDERVALGGDPLECEIGRAGLVVQRDDGLGVPHPANLLCIPWRTPSGDVDTLQRRRLDGERGSKYVFAAGRGPLHLYGVERLRRAAAGAELVIVEGALDTLARRKLDDAGRVVVGLPGASGWRAEWAEYARNRVVRLATDADDAGDKAAARIAADVWSAGASRVIRERSEGVDWAERAARVEL